MPRISLVPRRRTLILGAVVTGGVALLGARSAEAHFHLDAPASWMSQTANGDPQKTGPCGNEAGGTATGTVTKVTPQADGTSKVVIMWHDTVPHPGHYRIALSVNSRTELPPEPVVTPTTADQCASAAVATAPYSLPILADNVNPHTSTAVQGNQMLTVTIPASVSCTKCTLQVLEFMSNHGAPCFYHHCADLSIGSVSGGGGAAGGAGQGGTTATGGRGVGSGGAPGSGGAAAGTGGGGVGTGGIAAGSGGQVATGGAAVTSGGTTGSSGGASVSSGGATGSGGSSAGSGGTTGGSGGRPSADGAADSTSGDANSSGCACGIAPSRSPAAGLWTLALLLGVALARRRRRD